MDSKRFAFWLMGLLDAIDSNTPLTEKQVNLIKENINNITTDSSEKFVIWLHEYLTGLENNDLNISKTNLIRNKLNNLFDF